MDENILFEYYPYKIDKTIKVFFWVLCISFVGLIITSLGMIIEGLFKEDYIEILSSIIPFLLAILNLYYLLFLRNSKLQIFSNHISIYSLFGKEKKYELDTKLMTIRVNYTVARKRGFKLTFLDNKFSKVCSYVLLESMTSQRNHIDRRKKWGEDLKELGCSIEDKGNYLIEESTLINHV
ncbi:MAG: hypothetical protein KKH92_07845 [Firmicutes bacterium]|nr:hypothetical protein [Bacillota bacterium]